MKGREVMCSVVAPGETMDGWWFGYGGDSGVDAKLRWSGAWHGRSFED